MPVKDRVIFVPRGPRGATGEQGPAGDGAAALTPRVDELEDPRGRNLIYWHGINGNDANPGTLTAPVKSAERVCELLKANIPNLIYLQSDVVWDYYFDINNNLKVQISGGPNSHYAVTLTDAINSTNRKGGIRTDSYGTLILLYTKIYLDGQNNSPAFDATIGKWKVRTFSTNFEKIGSSQGFLFSNLYAGELVTFFQGAVFTNMEGHIFEGVAAMDNPNSKDLVFSNLNSA